MKGICVGLGDRGRMWYSWAREAGMEVVGVVDKNEEILHRSCDELGLPDSMRFAKIEDAAKATEARMAVVCTANPTHAGCIRECLDAGLHCFIEKPMVETVEEAREVVAHAEREKLTVGVVQNYRYTPGTLTLRDAVRSGTIGEILKVRVDFHRWRPTRGLKLPLMLNQAIHHFDGIRFILGADPLWCFAKSWNPDWNDCDEATVLEAIWEFEGGVIVTYGGSYVTGGASTPYSGTWRIEGSTGTLHFSEDTGVTLTRREPQEERKLPLAGCGMTETAKVCREFIEAVRSGKKPPTDSSDNVKSLAMCWSADISSRENRVVSIGEAM